MNRKQFFGNLIGLAGITTNAKTLATLGVGTKPAAATQALKMNKGYVSCVDPMLNTRDLNPIALEMLGGEKFMNKTQVFMESAEIKDIEL